MKTLSWVICVMLLATSAWPQAITGTILGAVSDQSGASLPAVTITATNELTGLKRTVVSNLSGNYAITNLPVGLYRIEAELGGFRKEVRSGVELQVDQRARTNFSMVVGRITESVDVNAENPLLQTDDAFVGSVTEGFRLTRLPLNGRQFESLALLLPGVVLPAPGSHLGARGGFNVAGMDEHYNSFFLDGIDNVDPVIRNFSFRPSVDLIQEFKVQENGGNAEFGRNAGAVINVTTKSGTNVFHGAGWEFIRNDNLDARSYFALPGTPQPPLIRNQFGATLGGPLRRNRTFFFAAYEGLRQKAGTARRASVPTARMRSGDLSELGGTILDPVTRLPFEGNVIPADRIHPISREVIQSYPLPNLPGVRGNRTEVASRIEDGNDISLKIDHQLLESTQMSGRYSYSVTRVLDPFRIESGGGVNLANFGQSADRIRTNVGLGFITAKRNFVNEFRAGYNRFEQPQLPLNPGTPGQERLMGFEKTFLGYTIPGFEPLGSGPEFNRTVNVYNYIENTSFIVGNHQLKSGMDIRRYLFNSYTIGPNFFIFNGARSSSSPLADFLLGLPFVSFSSTGSPGGNPRKTEMAFYLQDDWRANSRLTVSYGMRWEFYGRIKEKINKQSIWAPELNKMVVAGTNGVPPQLVDDDYNNFAPRFGFAFRPFPDSHTVIRGAGGIFYDNDMRHNSEVIGNPPFLANEQFLAPAIPNLSLDNPFPANAPASSLNVITFDRHYRDTYAEHWSLGVQRELQPNLLAEITYVGNHVVKARRGRNLNQPVNRIPPHPGFAQIILFEQAGSSNFNSLQTRVERRFSRGLFLTSGYTWGHAIDDRTGQGAGRIQNNYDMQSERADSDFDVRHRWTLGAVWEVPVGKGRRWGAELPKLIDAIVDGWGVNGIASVQGGRPFTVFLAQEVSNSGNNNDRPNVVPGVSWKPDEQTADGWINPAAFSIPAAGTFGNLGRNTLRGPQLHNIDLALVKDSRANDSVLVQIRAEFFNILNHPNFALPNATLDAPSSPAATSFGIIPSTITPERQIQFGLRVEF